MATRISFSVTSRGRYFVLTTATAGNPVPHKYVVTKGSKTFTALSDKLGQSFFTSSQN
jgi:hypothetical protein